MKANAPKKIYINPMPNPSDGYVGVAWSEPHVDMKEYTRTDAFIEKAEKFIYSALNDGIMGTANIEDFMRLFKNYMKGE
jgi:hypothetical protein